MYRNLVPCHTILREPSAGMWLWLLPNAQRFEALEKVPVQFTPRKLGQRVMQWLLNAGTVLVFTRHRWCLPFDCCLVHHSCMLAISSIIHVTSSFTTRCVFGTARSSISSSHGPRDSAHQGGDRTLPRPHRATLYGDHQPGTGAGCTCKGV